MTKENEGKGGTAATAGNKSTTTVAKTPGPDVQGAETTKETDIERIKREAEEKKAAEAAEAAEKDIDDEEFEKALKEPDVAEAPTEADLDKADAAEQDPKPAEKTPTPAPRDSRDPVIVFKAKKLVAALKAVGTTGEFTLYGYGGTVIKLSDLEELVK